MKIAAHFETMSTYTLEELPFLDGKFLIAMPGMGDPRFDHSVIFMCAHTPEGAMGLMINRPVADLSFSELMEQLGIQGRPDVSPDVLFGGPVENGRGFVLHSADYESEDSTMAITDDVGMTATMDVLRDIAEGKGPEKRLLCLGYSGWGPGQLEEEIQRNGWLICDGDPAIIFDVPVAEKWVAAAKTLGFDPAMLSAEGGRA